MGVVPQETTQINSVDIDATTPVIVAPAYPVLPLQNSAGTFTGAAASTIVVNISNTTIITPNFVRVTDALGVDHDQAYVADGNYTFLLINTQGNVTVTLF